MQYINPIEILGLSNVIDTSSIDNEIIKKAKRKLIADIDLSDNGLFEYYGIQLTKGDCEKVIDELANNDLKEFYLYLASNKKLNNFIVNGNDDVFVNFRQDSIFKLPEFIKFVSPFFAPRFDKALLNAFECEDVEQTKSILKTSFLIYQSEINIAYKSVSNTIQNNIFEIAEITNDIKNEEGVYDINELVDLVVDYFPSEILNCLPNYFQSQILKIAKAINNLNVAIWDNFDNSQVCNDLLEHVLTLNISGLEKPTFQKNYEIVRKKNKERNEQLANAPILKKYADYLVQSRSKIKEIENKTTNPVDVLYWVSCKISINEINRLESVFDEIKNQVANSLKALSIEVWNSFKNIEISIDLINQASSIQGLKSDVLQNIQKTKFKLNEINSKIKLEYLNKLPKPKQNQISEDPVETEKTEKTDYSSTIFWVFCILGFLIISIWASSVNKTAEVAPRKTESNTNPSLFNNNSETQPNAVSEVPSNYSLPVESEYKGNQLKNGASPLKGCFGIGSYEGRATLTVKNGGSSDAIICLYSTSEDRTIRNEYVRKNSSFTMFKIAQGDYKIRVFYGNDWNPDLENSCGTKGNFESDINFSEFDGTEYFEDSNRGYTNATITLYTVAGGNATSSAIDQSKFFSK